MTNSKTTLLVITAIALSGCGSGVSLNPFNWFSQEEPVEQLNDVDIAQFVDDRPLVQSVEGLVIERLPGGVIIRATGLPPMQGWYDAQLVREGGAAAGTGVAVYSFRARPPEQPTRVSTQQSRELIAAAFLSNIELEAISSIRVIAASNARSARR
ncbi:MAG: hypothetical protein HKP37_05010 [Boseongicola sp.]|nr:hypothetical protein [Boseongicola sp.]NNL18084.1 hypothetical protein [Boseongicola sp.]